jgi:hypothetical protein
MRLLADENFPKPIVEALRAGGHDDLWARTDLAGVRSTHRADVRQGLLGDCSSSPQPTGAIRGRAVPSSSRDSRTTRAACGYFRRGGHCVGWAYQHHRGRRNSDGRGAQKVKRLSAVVFSSWPTGESSIAHCHLARRFDDALSVWHEECLTAGLRRARNSE